jgi:hypothetical protein
MTAVCLGCGGVFFLADGHACTGRPLEPAGASDPRDRTLVPAANLRAVTS